MNVHAAHSLFGMLLGIGVVVLFLVTEWMAGNIRLRTDSEAERKAAETAAAAQAAAAALAASTAWIASCSHPKQCASEVQCLTKKASVAKAAKTRKRTEKNRKLQEQALQSLLDNPATADDPAVRVLRVA